MQYREPDNEFITIYNTVEQKYHDGQQSPEDLEEYIQAMENLYHKMMESDISSIHPAFRLSVLKILLYIRMDKEEFSKANIIIQRARPIIYETLRNLPGEELIHHRKTIEHFLYSAYNSTFGESKIESREITAKEFYQYIEFFTLISELYLFVFKDSKKFIEQLQCLYKHQSFFKNHYKFYYNFIDDYSRYLVYMTNTAEGSSPACLMFSKLFWQLNSIESLIGKKRYKEAFSSYNKSLPNTKELGEDSWFAIQLDKLKQALFTQSGMNEEQLTNISKDQEFHEAITGGDYEKGKKLLTEGADINFSPEFYDNSLGYQNPLLNGIQDKDFKKIQFLVDNGVDLDYGYKVVKGEDFSMTALPPLQTAINLYYKYDESKDGPNKTLVFKIIKFLLDKGADPNKSNPLNGGGTLSTAIGGDGEENVRKGEYEIIELLLKYGADPDRKDWQGYNALYSASASNDIKLFTYLAEHGGNIESRFMGKFGLIHAAAMDGSISILDYLVAQGHDINNTDVNDFSPLDYAISYKKPETINHIQSIGGKVSIAPDPLGGDISTPSGSGVAPMMSVDNYPTSEFGNTNAAEEVIFSSEDWKLKKSFVIIDFPLVDLFITNKYLYITHVPDSTGYHLWLILGTLSSLGSGNLFMIAVFGGIGHYSNKKTRNKTKEKWQNNGKFIPSQFQKNTLLQIPISHAHSYVTFSEKEYIKINDGKVSVKIKKSEGDIQQIQNKLSQFPKETPDPKDIAPSKGKLGVLSTSITWESVLIIIVIIVLTMAYAYNGVYEKMESERKQRSAITSVSSVTPTESTMSTPVNTTKSTITDTSKLATENSSNGGANTSDIPTKSARDSVKTIDSPSESNPSDSPSEPTREIESLNDLSPSEYAKKGLSRYFILNTKSLHPDNYKKLNISSLPGVANKGYDPQKAIIELEKINISLESNSNKVIILVTIGNLKATFHKNYFFINSDYREAIRYTEPYTFENYYVQGRLDSVDNKPASAIKNLETAYRYDPADYFVNVYLSEFYLDIEDKHPELSDYPKAVLYAKKADELSGGNFDEAKELLLNAYYFNKDYDNAIKLGTEIESQNKNFVHLILGYSYLFKKNYSLSLKYFQLAKANGEEVDEEILAKLISLVKLENESMSPEIIDIESESEKKEFKNEI